MDHYLFTARSITYAQQMAQAMESAGVPVKMRRVGNGVTKSGCGYTLQVPERQFRRAAEALREAELRPIKVFHVVNGARTEVAL